MEDMKTAGTQKRIETGVDRIVKIGLPAITLIVVVVAWQISAWIFQPPLWLLPSPVNVVKTSIEWSEELPRHFLVTLYETIVGFIASIVLGIPISVLIVYSKFLQRTIYPILLALQSVPKVAIAPLLLMWVGHGELPKIIVVFLVCFFPIVVSATAGMQAVPAALLDLVRSLSAGQGQVFLKIRLPYSLPYIFVGLKVAITLAVIGAVIGEFVGSNQGLGYLILISTQQFDTALAFAAIILLTLMSIILFYVVEYLERLIVPWATDL
jgi:NitT/TauT family transport system permease protein